MRRKPFLLLLLAVLSSITALGARAKLVTVQGFGNLDHLDRL
jgi:hypothetical protein